MARSYYSMVIDDPAEAVWAVIRPFGHYSWAGVPGATVIEDDKADDQVSAVRRVSVGERGERTIRQVLLAHSDTERSYTYAFVGAPPFPVRDYMATIRVSPVVESNTAFVEWWATFDCAADEVDRWTAFFARDGFATWLGALRQFMRANGAA